MVRSLGFAVLFSLLVTANAQTEVVWWDFLIGGDGVRMRAMIDDFNQSHPDIQIVPTTLEWGETYYTRVQTAAAVGEGPDIMTYHLSRYWRSSRACCALLARKSSRAPASRAKTTRAVW